MAPNVLKPCGLCDKTITTANWSRHRAQRHGLPAAEPHTRGEQDHCGECGPIGRNQRRRHFKNKHGGMPPPGSRLRDTIVQGPVSGAVSAASTGNDSIGAKDHSDSSVVGLEASDAGTSLVGRYDGAVKPAKERVCDQIRAQLAEIPPDNNCRLSFELRKYQQEVERSIYGRTIGFGEYMDTVLGLPADHPGLQRLVVVCTMHDASKILTSGCLRIPLVVPSPGTGSPTVEINEYLDYLASKSTVDVHVFNKQVDPDGRYFRAESLPAAAAVALFRDIDAGPVNFLNLDIYKPNEIPPCFIGVKALDILRTSSETNESGKPLLRQPSDLSSCRSFQICGKKSVFSLPHRDHHGVVTTAFVEEGEKLWLSWPYVPPRALDQWTTTDDVAPEPAPFPVYLTQGDLLIQPAGQIHAPYSMTDVLMTGTMHWDSRDMVQVLEKSIYEVSHPAVTNEDPAKEFDSKLAHIGTLWKQGKLYPWGTDEELAEYLKLLQVSHNLFSTVPILRLHRSGRLSLDVNVLLAASSPGNVAVERQSRTVTFSATRKIGRQVRQEHVSIIDRSTLLLFSLSPTKSSWCSRRKALAG
ncbi:hypothetical protein MMC06_003125 [Schaereria dolodes]|nr:hypothetical protein [Schaereria dolodes]